MKRKVVKRKPRRVVVPSHCHFCKEKKVPWFSDTSTLRKFTTERGKIIARMRTGICAKHQRRLTTAIKHARHLALLPFVAQE